MKTLVIVLVLISLDSLCFGQTSKTGTKKIMIKGEEVETPIFITESGSKTYYDVHPEERTMDAVKQDNKPLEDLQEQLIEDIRTREQGYGLGFHKDHSSPSSLLPPSPSSSSAPSPPSGLIETRSGAIDSQTGDFYPRVKGGVVNSRTGQFMPDVGGGYIDPSTGRFIPKQ